MTNLVFVKEDFHASQKELQEMGFATIPVYYERKGNTRGRAWLAVKNELGDLNITPGFYQGVGYENPNPHSVRRLTQNDIFGDRWKWSGLPCRFYTKVEVIEENRHMEMPLHCFTLIA